jgi:hypothetical protein
MMKRPLFGFLTAIAMLVALLLAFPLSAGGASPDIPRGFYGTVSINGRPAPVNTYIQASGEGVRSGIKGNPFTTSLAGSYGEASEYGDKVIVEGINAPIAAGTIIKFYVNGVQAEQSFVWPASSSESLNNQLNLTVNIPVGSSVTPTPTSTPVITVSPPPPPYTTVSPYPPPSTANPGLTVLDLLPVLDANGKFLRDFEGRSSDGGARINILAGTLGKTRDGAPLTQITIQKVANPGGALSSQANFKPVGLLYDFQPGGAQFSPAVTLTLTFDPAQAPAGQTPFIAWWNAADGLWEKLETLGVDVVNHTVTARTTHFTIFGAFANRLPAASIPVVTTPALTPAPVISTPALASNPPASSPAALKSGNSYTGLIIGLTIAVVILSVIIIVLLKRKPKKDISK